MSDVFWTLPVDHGQPRNEKVSLGDVSKKEILARSGSVKTWADMTEAERAALSSQYLGTFTAETPAQKSARARRMSRILRDKEQAKEMAELILQGHTTESARQEMGWIGIVRAQRIRAVAVRMGLIPGRGTKP